MKRACKKVQINHFKFILSALEDCFASSRKRNRFDTRAMFKSILGTTNKRTKEILINKEPEFYEALDTIAYDLLERIESRDLRLPPLKISIREDKSTRKIRKISILSIDQLMFDHIACNGLKELTKRIGEFQVSSIKGRGARYGVAAIKRWLTKRDSKYATKIDIKNFYGSVDKTKLLSWISKRVNNDLLIWLLSQLLNTLEDGIPIGSYLSQTLANLYLSDLYHFAMEKCLNKRGKNQISHALFYMDDMLFISPNKRQLKLAVQSIIERANKELGLIVKPNWNVYKISESHPVDMMGFRMSKGRITLRKRIFKMTRRCIIRAARLKCKKKLIGLKFARRLTSFYGYIIRTNSYLFNLKTKSFKLFHFTFKLISKCTKLNMVKNRRRWKYRKSKGTTKLL